MIGQLERVDGARLSTGAHDICGDERADDQRRGSHTCNGRSRTVLPKTNADQDDGKKTQGRRTEIEEEAGDAERCAWLTVDGATRCGIERHPHSAKRV